MSDELPESPPASMPGWVMTFADLMSLLMCFFVLLLSFSEMDLQKFKQVAGSMEKAFGVQRQIKSAEPPRGTSIIAQEFSPGRPEPTPFNEVRQKAAAQVDPLLQIEEDASDVKSEASAIARQLVGEIRSGNLEVETRDEKIIIRILEEGSFPSGSDILRESFFPVLEKIKNVLANTPGKITVAGFTDDIPINTDRFSSNWALSAARAVSVVNELLADNRIDKKRITIKGLADNMPLMPNDTPENRGVNRRVELIVEQYEEPKVKSKDLTGKDKEKVSEKPKSKEDEFDPSKAENGVVLKEDGKFEVIENDMDKYKDAEIDSDGLIFVPDKKDTSDNKSLLDSLEEEPENIELINELLKES